MKKSAGLPGKSDMPPKLEEDAATERVQIVAPASWIAKVQDWRRAQPDLPNMSAAIRRLVEAGLEAREEGR